MQYGPVIAGFQEAINGKKFQFSKNGKEGG